MRNLVAAIILLLQVGDCSAQSVKLSARDEDVICGPLAIRKVLALHGLPSDFRPILQFAKTRKNEEGLSLAEMKSYLIEQGLYVEAVRLSGDRIEWNEPMIAFFRNPNQRAGHYGVLFKENGTLVVWARPGEQGEFHRTCYQKLFDGELLLTSKSPIDIDRFNRSEEMGSRSVSPFLMVGAGAVVLWLVWKAFRLIRSGV